MSIDWKSLRRVCGRIRDIAHSADGAHVLFMESRPDRALLYHIWLCDGDALFEPCDRLEDASFASVCVQNWGLDDAIIESTLSSERLLDFVMDGEHKREWKSRYVVAPARGEMIGCAYHTSHVVALRGEPGTETINIEFSALTMLADAECRRSNAGRITLLSA